MRVICPHCNNKATVTHNVILSKGVNDLYCLCKNCKAKFVFILAYKHDIKTSSLNTDELALALVEAGKSGVTLTDLTTAITALGGQSEREPPRV